MDVLEYPHNQQGLTFLMITLSIQCSNVVITYIETCHLGGHLQTGCGS